MTSPAADELWVFGYGSLMWRPDFPFIERVGATMTGYHRCFCIASTHHRGSPARPGLVLGLDLGGYCAGVAYRVHADGSARVLAYLRQRELVNGVYREVFAPVRLADGRRVTAVTYIVERAHPSYMPPLPLTRQAFIIRGARGLSGNNLDYLINTVRHLRDSGIRERQLERLVALSGPHLARSAVSVRPGVEALRQSLWRRPLDVRRLPKGERRRFLYRLRLVH